jgi:hypothetical protein
MKYEYRVEPDGDWYCVYEGTVKRGFDRVAEFKRLDDAEQWAYEKAEDQKRG